MPKDTCAIHDKALPCKACAGALGGRVSSPKKSKANRAKAKRAAMIRWYGRDVKSGGRDAGD